MKYEIIKTNIANIKPGDCIMENGVMVTVSSSRTERDKLVELIKTYRNTFRSDTEFANAILAAGFSLGAK